MTEMGNHWARWRAIYLYGLFLLVSTFGNHLKVGPEVRLFELLVCPKYYLEHNAAMVDNHGKVPEEYCKLDEIQGQLGMLRGWLFSCLLLAGMLVTIPFGVLADSTGWKLVVVASLASVTLTKVWIIIICGFFSVVLDFMYHKCV